MYKNNKLGAWQISFALGAVFYGKLSLLGRIKKFAILAALASNKRSAHVFLGTEGLATTC